MSKINKKIVVIIISVATILGMGGFITYAYIYNSNLPRHFDPQRKILAQKYYDNIMNIDNDSKYPATADEVMDLYLESTRLLYGKCIIDNKVLAQVLHQQRILLSEDILELNSENEQFENLLNSLEVLYEKDIYCTGFDKKPAIYNEEDGIYSYRVKQYNNRADFIYRIYYLSKEGIYWKITNWKATDENYE